MKIPYSLLLVVLLSALAASAQKPASTPKPASPPTNAAGKSSAQPAAQAKKVNRAEAYFHFQLGHAAVKEYKAALQADPGSSYLAGALAQL